MLTILPLAEVCNTESPSVDHDILGVVEHGHATWGHGYLRSRGCENRYKIVLLIWRGSSTALVLQTVNGGPPLP